MSFVSNKGVLALICLLGFLSLDAISYVVLKLENEVLSMKVH